MNINTVTDYLDLLGKTGEDKVTGASGVIESVGFDLYGCVQVVLRGKANEQNKVEPGLWMDVSRITITSHKRVMALPEWHPAQPEPKPKSVHGPAQKPLMRG